MNGSKRNSFIISRDAQAFTIFAVLLIVIVATTTATYLAIHAPRETAHCEFEHTWAVSEDFQQLASTINFLLSAQSAGASTSVPIIMTPTRESTIALPLTPGSLTFSPVSGRVCVRLNESGTNTSGSWVVTNFIENVTAVPVGKVNVKWDEIRLMSKPFTSGYVVSNLTNTTEGHVGKDTGSNSTIYGNFTWETRIPSADTQIIMRIRSGMFPNMTQAKPWHECPELESIDGTNTVALATVSSVSNGHRYLQYRADLKTWDPNTSPTLNNGITVEYTSPPDPVTLANASGTITFTSNYNYHNNLELSYLSGAAIQWQKEGGFIANAERFQQYFAFTNASGTPQVNLSLIDLQGTNSSLSGVPAGYVRLLRLNSETLADPFYYPHLRLEVASDHPTIWANWFNQTLECSGLTSPDDYAVRVNTTTNTVEVTLDGHETGIKLYMERMEVLTNLQK